MGVDILCFHCTEPTLLDVAGTAAATYLLGLLVLTVTARVGALRSLIGSLQPLAVSTAVPITVGVLAGVLSEFPAYVAVGLGAAAAVMPIAIVVIADLAERWRPDAALDLTIRRDPRLGHTVSKEDRCSRAV